MKISKKVIVVVGIILFLVTGIIVWNYLYKPSFLYAGTIEVTRIDLPARLPTVIGRILVEEGQSVTKGEKLAELACEDVNLKHQLIAKNYERAAKLNSNGAISKEAFDIASNSKNEADLQQSWCTITSPVDGTVLTKFLEPKEWVNPGSKILTVADLERPWAYFYVPQAVMAKLKVGSEVTGIIADLGNREFRGHIIKINDEAEFTPKNVQTQAERTRLIFGIKVEFNNPDRILKPGMSIESQLVE